MDPVAFWGPLEPRGGATDKKFRSRTTRRVTKQQLDRLQATQATRVMVAEAMKQVRELHGDESIPVVVGARLAVYKFSVVNRLSPARGLRILMGWFCSD
jgi:hypothetical protein